MANPSLQIGNSNWAIKEDDLLGYSTVGTNYLPKPMTMTRASAGTRVNSAGLVKTVELLGGEEIDCGNFECASPYTDWAVTGSVTIGSGVATFVDDGTNPNSGIAQNVLPYNKTFKIVFDITRYVGGRIQITAGGGTYSVDISGGVGVYTTIIQSASSTTFRIKRDGGYSGWDFDIDNVSVKEATTENLPRIDYTDGTSSLLVEPQRTNLITYSEDFSDSSWINTYTITPNSIISPDGTLNAYKITLGTGNGNLRTLNSVSSNTDYVFSFYAKRGTASEMKYRVFDFTNPYADIIPKTSYYSQTNTDSWVRIEVPFTTGASTTSIGCYIDSDSQGNGDFYAWGAQLEEGSYPTSYIPTDGGTVTRVKETYEKTGISNLINSEEGSFFVDIAALNTYPGSQISISLSGNGSNDRVLIYTGSGGGKWIAQFRKDGTTIVNIEKNTTITNQSKLAVSWKSGKYLMYIDGDKATNYTVGSETEATTFDSGDLKNLQFSPFYNSSGNNFYGKVKQLQVYTTALTDSELITLTT